MRGGGVEVPQFDSLARVRLVLEAWAGAEGVGGPSTASVARALRVTERNVAYALHAARALGLLGGRELTPLGRELCASAAGGEAERACLRRAVAASEVVQAVAPGLLGEPGPTLAEVAARIVEVGGLSRSTALRRAQALLAWRGQLTGAQASLL